jgi:RNA polymerase sigma factor (sigma-70 family)
MIKNYLTIAWRNLRKHSFYSLINVVGLAIGVAASLMRQILVDHARRQRADKRGGGDTMLSLDDVSPAAQATSVDVLALDQALDVLSSIDCRQCRVVELRFFAGLNIDEAAEALGISPATVEREWVLAKAWLFRRLSARNPEWRLMGVGIGASRLRSSRPRRAASAAVELESPSCSAEAGPWRWSIRRATPSLMCRGSTEEPSIFCTPLASKWSVRLIFFPTSPPF